MNYSNAKQPDIVIDFKEELWNLLSRWKIILIVAIIMAVLVEGFMYLRADQQHKAAIKEKKEAEARSSQSLEERSAIIMDDYELTEYEQKVIIYLVQQQEMAKSLNEYLDSSLLLNLNPSNQRIMSLTYYLKGADADLQALVDGYEFYLHRKTSLRQIGDVISPGTDLKHIYELMDGWSGAISDSDATGIDFTVKIVLPEDADASAVEEVVTRILRKGRAEVRKSIGEHTISLINKEDINRYNSDAVDRRTAVTNNINSLQNNIKNYRATLSPDQLEALNKVSDVYNGTEGEGLLFGGSSANKDSRNGAKFNLLYLLAGFILGIVLYVVIYVYIVIRKRRITTVEYLTACTNTRIMGVIHGAQQNGNGNWLKRSRLIDRIRYKNENDSQKELRETADRVEAICAHMGITDIHSLQLVNPNSEGNRCADDIYELLKANGIQVQVIEINDSVEEKALLSVQNAIILAEHNCSAEIIWNCTQRCKEFDVNLLGSVFVK